MPDGNKNSPDTDPSQSKIVPTISLVENILSKSEKIPEEGLIRLRELRAQLDANVIFTVFENEVIYGSTVSTLQQLIKHLVENNTIPKSYQQFLDPLIGLQKDENVFSTSIDPTTNPTTPTETWFTELIKEYGVNVKQFEHAGAERFALATELGKRVPQIEIATNIASTLLKKFGFTIIEIEQITTLLQSKISFSHPTHPYYEKQGDRSYKLMNVRGRHSRLDKEIKLPPESYIDPESLRKDIASTEHEIIHWLKTQGYIKQDILIPIASAQTVVSLVENGQPVVNGNNGELHNFTVNQAVADKLSEILTMAKTPWVVFIRSQQLLFPQIPHSISMSDHLINMQSLCKEGEPDQTYLAGSLLGTVLIMKNGVNYAQGFIHGLSRGYNPAQAEAVGQLTLKGISPEKIQTKMTEPPLSELSDLTTYEQIDNLLTTVII